MKRLQWFIFICFLCYLNVSIGAPKKTRVYKVYVGKQLVKLVQVSYGSGKHFVHVHQSERTAKRAALTYIKRHGGSLLTLVHPGERNIAFILRHQRYAFDPNRIFTDRGIKKTLRAQSHYSPAAAIEVKKLAQLIVRHLPQGKVIAVHNNQEYSMREYLQGHDLMNDARALQQRHQHSYRNFYMVTKKSSFLRLQRLAQNVVWQSAHVQDDGSLSVYFTRRDYVNVEAGYQAFSEQLRMLGLA